MNDPSSYCLAIESYLCRKNDGHLIRIVGPAFERVCGWSKRGIPLTAVYRGIDRYFERYYAKGPRRRPVRVDFCEADILDVFDEWRRAVGVVGPARLDGRDGSDGQDGSDGKDGKDGTGEGVASGFSRKRSLATHLERVVARLTALRAAPNGRSLADQVDAVVRELDGARAVAKGLRGEAREALLARLRAIDANLLEAARNACDAGAIDSLRADAELELAPFRDRMAADAYQRSREACIAQLIRERWQLPVVAFE